MVEYILDPTLSALADPTRRAIITALGKRERRVTDVAAPFDMSLNAVSKHIKKLEQAGLIHRRKDGRDHYISVNPEPIKATAAWFDEQRRFWNSRLDRLEALIKEERDNE